MVTRPSQRAKDLRLALRAADRLLEAARLGEREQDDWTIEELESLRTDIAAQLVAETLALSPLYVRPR